MSGRSCERCWKEKLGYCPFDFICKDEVYSRFGRMKAILAKERELMEKGIC